MDEAIDDLESMDWELVDADTNKYSAAIHPYHARFIPQIPERLIEAYTDPGEVVLDPFNGSGTTTMVAGALQRKGVGVDLNPLACLIARVKSRNYDIPELEAHVEDFLEEAKTNIRAADSQQRLDDFSQAESTQPPQTIPEFPDRERWYTAEVLDQLGALYYLVESVDDQHLSDFYRICFSGILKPVCRSDEDWTYIGDNMIPDRETNKLTPVNKNYDVYDKFKQQTERVLDALAQYADANPVEADIYHQDSRQLSEFVTDDVDFAMTSPPYPNAVDYARYHRLTFYWFGWEITETKEDEIGARSKRGRKRAVEDYFEESRAVYEAVYDLLRSESRFCIVIGDTQHKNERVEAVDTVTEMCKDIGFTHDGTIDRELHKQSMSQKNITEESIIILSKQ